MPAPSESRLDWAAHQGIIEDLYWNHEKELPDVMETMKNVYGFVATKKMYKKHFKAWGLEKNLKREESIAMIMIAEQRRMANKRTVFIRRGRIVEPGKLRRFAKRHNLAVDRGASLLNETQVTTPPYITYATPEPDPSDASLSPAAQPYPDPEVSEEEPASPGSLGVSSDASPPSRNIPWDPPLAIAWPPDDAYTESQQTTHTIGAPFDADAFSVRPVEGTLHGVSPFNMSTTFSPSSWPTSEPQISGGITPPWNFGWPQQQQQHMAHPTNWGPQPNLPVLAIGHSPEMSHAMLGLNHVGNASPNRGLNGIPDTQFGPSEHWPLHNAVVYNNLSLARTLLEGGADANCAARGGITPLHYAANQRSVEAVKLLLDHGANLDAVTDNCRSVLAFALRKQGDLGGGNIAALPSQTTTPADSPSHTDEDTVRVIGALFNSPTRWIRLLRSLDKADSNGVTPLMIAAGEGFHNTAAMLLERGARPELRDHANHTALKYAARRGHRELVRLLLLADPAVSCERDLSHILKLASKNFTGRGGSSSSSSSTKTTSQGRGGGEDGGSAESSSWNSWSASALIAEEMAYLCQEMGVLDDVLRLARQRCKTNVLELLMGAATRQLGGERGGSVDVDVDGGG